jgi:mono/diheme cytochrome c family protein
MRWPLAILLCVVVAGCTRSNMDSQPKYHEYEKSGLFPDGRVLQAPPAGTVRRDESTWAEEAKNKPTLTPQLFAKGREKFDVFCAPCHDRVGTGRGIVVERGMPQPPSLHDPRLLIADDQHLYDVITNGYGSMFAHSDRIRPRDRWAIVAYIRALQLSQHAALSDLPSDVRAKMLAESPP